MTAPLLSTLLAVLFAGLGYVAGRVHQWHRGAWDREEAYRDGYDEATRSTLSMAARLAAPGRSPSADNPAHTDPSTSGPAPSAPLSAQGVPGGRSALPATRGAAVNLDALGVAATRGAPSKPDALGVAATRSAAVSSNAQGLASPHVPVGSGAADLVSDSRASVPADVFPAPGSPIGVAASGSTSTESSPAGDAPRVGGGDGSSIDSPGPVQSSVLSLPGMPGPAFSAPGASGPGASGPGASGPGALDPALSGPGASGPAVPFAPADAASGPALIPGARSGTGGERGAFFEPVVQEPSAVDEVPVPRLGRRGRHYVPDELVRAATYRLSPDRVARAKVPDALPPDDDTPEPPHHHVPRPRSS